MEPKFGLFYCFISLQVRQIICFYFRQSLNFFFKTPAGSGHGKFNYLRAAPRSEEERQEQRKAARLSLDTSAHGGERYRQLLHRLDSGPRDRKVTHTSVCSSLCHCRDICLISLRSELRAAELMPGASC